MTGRVLSALLIVVGLPGVAGSAEPGVAVVHRGRLLMEREIPGWLESRDRQELVAPRLRDHSTWVVTRVVPSGESVARGQVVIELDPAEAGWHLRRAQGRLALAKAREVATRARLAAERLDAELAQRRAAFAIERAELKAKKGVGLTPRLDMERAALDRKAAKLELDQAGRALAAYDRRAEALLAEEDQALAEAGLEVEQARRAIAATSLVALVAGRVRLAPGLEPGAVVRPGQLMAELLAPGHLVARFRVDLDPKMPFRPAALVGLSVPGSGGARLGAKIIATRLCAPGASGAVSRVELLVAPQAAAAGIAPGDPVRLSIRMVVDEQALLVPAQAIFAGPDGPVVWCLDAPAGYRRVELGRRTPELVEILSGLAEGERISLDPRAQAQAAPAEPVGPPPDTEAPAEGRP